MLRKNTGKGVARNCCYSPFIQATVINACKVNHPLLAQTIVWKNSGGRKLPMRMYAVMASTYNNYILL